jgi:membrane protein DedA with SNARE-associated domain
MDSFLVHAGYGALMLLGFLEACCVPIPSDVTFGFAGVLAYQGHLSLALIIVLGTAAELAGSYVAYTVGRVAERPVIERVGRYLLITKSDIDRAERFLARRGRWAIPVGRALPLVRSFTSLAAGFARVPALQFGVFSLAGTLVYAAAVTSIGYGLGSAWGSVAHGLSIAGYVFAVVFVAAIAVFVVVRLRELRREARAGAAAGAGTGGQPGADGEPATDGQPAADEGAAGEAGRSRAHETGGTS